MITEDYVSFETAKLLKERGFKEWCFHCYGVAVLHNGAYISFDEECDLKSDGRENEIEYVEGDRLFDYGCNNSDKDAKVWAAPTLWVAMKWLREVHKIIPIILTGEYRQKPLYYWFRIDAIIEGRLKDAVYREDEKEFSSYEEACDAAIKYCLENLI